MAQCTFYMLDAFTSRPFTGNPCAVVPDATGLDDRLMTCIARETNAPETAFVFSASPTEVRVRYFMPRGEIPFAGHPTIATGYLLHHLGKLKSETTVHFVFNSGAFRVDIMPAGSQDIILTQPAPTPDRYADRHEVAEALGITAHQCYGEYPAQLIKSAVSFLIVPVATVQTLHNLTMDRSKLKRLLSCLGVQAAYVFAPEGIDPATDVHARLLDPDNPGEDPFTGSAAGCMAAYMHAHGLMAGNKCILEQGHILQRPGTGRLELLVEQSTLAGVRLAGTATLTGNGTLHW